MEPRIMLVGKYIPAKMYGFLIPFKGAGDDVYFHLSQFQQGSFTPPSCNRCPVSGCSWSSCTPPPILGERVEVEMGDADPSKAAPRASRVVRLDDPSPLHGTVVSFDPQRGYGFTEVGGASYHVHVSEMVDNKIPVQGSRISFYAGMRQGRPRACHIKVCG